MKIKNISCISQRYGNKNAVCRLGEDTGEAHISRRTCGHDIQVREDTSQHHTGKHTGGNRYVRKVLGALALACQGSKAKAPGSATNPRREAAVVKSNHPVRAGTRTARPVTRNDWA